MPRRNQEGMVLIVVLVVLVVTLLAGMGVLRAVQTGNAMSGNFSFRQSGLHASDRALSDAMSEVATRVVAGPLIMASNQDSVPRGPRTRISTR